MPTMLERLRDAQNAHDAKQMAALFADDYASSQPVHPGRAFVGPAQVLQNWTAAFEGVSDSFRSWCLSRSTAIRSGASFTGTGVSRTARSSP
jgi:hypothetical protein